VALLKIINGILPGISTEKKYTKVKKWKEPLKLRVASTGKLRHYSRTMKGKFLYIFGGGGILLGAFITVKLFQSFETIKEKDELIEVHVATITGLETAKATLETDKAALADKLVTTTKTLSSTETKLSDLTTEHYKTIAVQQKVEEKLMEQISAQDKEISALNSKLSTAQNKNRDYDSQIKTLNSQMIDKDREIDDIGRRLKSTEEDRDHLLIEQKKLIAEKAELEKQFQDILVLRKKVQQLQVELMASKKLEWLRRGFYGGARKKGGSQLMSMSKKNDRKTVSTNADLNVEVRRDGTVKIVPIETNSPTNGATP
jgi:DNA repair exonuclease SbcCD ATPase subunit